MYYLALWFRGYVTRLTTLSWKSFASVKKNKKVRVFVCAVLCDVLKVLWLRPFFLLSCGESVEWYWPGGGILGGKSVPLPLWPPCISHGMAWYQTRPAQWRAGDKPHEPRHENWFTLRFTLFWDITQRIVAIPHRRFGTTYRSHLIVFLDPWRWDR